MVHFGTGVRRNRGPPMAFTRPPVSRPLRWGTRLDTKRGLSFDDACASGSSTNTTNSTSEIRPVTRSPVRHRIPKTKALDWIEEETIREKTWAGVVQQKTWAGVVKMEQVRSNGLLVRFSSRFRKVRQILKF